MNLNSSAEHSVIYEIFIDSLEPGFCYIYVSSCPRSYTNLQSFRRYVRGEHLWFFEMYLKVFDKDLPSNLNKSQQDENDFSPVENIVDHEEEFEIEEDFDHFDTPILLNFNTVVDNILHELWKHLMLPQLSNLLYRREDVPNYWQRLKTF